MAAPWKLPAFAFGWESQVDAQAEVVVGLSPFQMQRQFLTIVLLRFRLFHQRREFFYILRKMCDGTTRLNRGTGMALCERPKKELFRGFCRTSGDKIHD